MLLALTAGCNAQTPKINDDSGPGAASSSQSTESIQPTQAGEEAAQTSYTMADIKALKNTEHFAKNTLEHIFDGTINGKGKATGYHYTKVSDSKGKIIDGTRSDADENGVFTGKVEGSTPPMTTRSAIRATRTARSGSATAATWRSTCISTLTRRSLPRSLCMKETDDELRDQNHRT